MENESVSKCPYCQFMPMPLPAEQRPHLHVKCPQCGKKPLATFVPLRDGKIRVIYRRDGRYKVVDDPMEVVSVRVPAWAVSVIHAKGADWARMRLTSGLKVV